MRGDAARVSAMRLRDRARSGEGAINAGAVHIEVRDSADKVRPIALMRTPWERIASHHCAAVMPSAETSKKTRFVSTVVGQ